MQKRSGGEWGITLLGRIEVLTFPVSVWLRRSGFGQEVLVVRHLIVGEWGRLPRRRSDQSGDLGELVHRARQLRIDPIGIGNHGLGHSRRPSGDGVGEEVVHFLVPLAALFQLRTERGKGPLGEHHGDCQEQFELVDALEQVARSTCTVLPTEAESRTRVVLVVRIVEGFRLLEPRLRSGHAGSLVEEFGVLAQEVCDLLVSVALGVFGVCGVEPFDGAPRHDDLERQITVDVLFQRPGLQQQLDLVQGGLLFEEQLLDEVGDGRGRNRGVFRVLQINSKLVVHNCNDERYINI